MIGQARASVQKRLRSEEDERERWIAAAEQDKEKTQERQP
jgi:hypothetical protein